MEKKIIILSLILCLIIGCTIVYNQPSTPPAQQASVDNSIPKSPPDNDSWKPANISEAITACNKIQMAEDIPVSCSFEYLEGKPCMFIGFPDIPTMEQHAPIFTKMIAAPFCEMTNETNRQGLLFYVVKNKNMANMYSCESDELTGWFNLDELPDEGNNENWKPSNLSEVIELCKQIQKDQDIPVGCSFQYIKGTPAIYVLFPDATTAKHYINEVAEYIALPFCSCTNQANRQGLIVFVAQKENIANFYNCESEEFTGWFSLKDAREL